MSNIPFYVVECTAEDAGYPAANFLAHSQDSPGWVTPPQCSYPQHLTLRLHTPARLHQLQLLSHEFKIAGKIEIQVAAPSNHDGSPNEGAPPAASTNFARLGFMSFDTNEKTNFSARELKSVTLPAVEASFIKFIFHRCHQNRLNTHNQVGLIMLNILGDPLPEYMQQAHATSIGGSDATQSRQAASSAPLHHEGSAAAQLANEQQRQQHHASSPQHGPHASNALDGGMVGKAQTHQVIQQHKQTRHTNPRHQDGMVGGASMSANLAVDSVTSERIRELQAQKAAAVAIEDYDEAKRLKLAVDCLFAAGAKIAVLEARKAEAVKAEDYDSAKALKIELERMRQRAYAAAMRGQPFSDAHDSPHAASSISVMGRNHDGNHQHVATVAATSTGANSSRMRPLSPAQSVGGSSSSHGMYVTAMDRETVGPHQSPSSLDMTAATTTSSEQAPDWNNHDERPARAKGTYDLANMSDEALAVFEREGTGASPSNAGPSQDKNPSGGATTTQSSMQGHLHQHERRFRGSIPQLHNRGANKDDDATNAGDAPSIEADAGPLPAGFPSGLPPPEPLSLDNSKDAGPLVALVGEYLGRCMYTTAWQLREAGFACITFQLTSPELIPELEGNGDALRTLCALVSAGLKDRLPAIAIAAMGLLRGLGSCIVERKLPLRDVHAAFADLTSLVADKTTEPAQRVRDCAVQTLVHLAKIKEAGLKALAPSFVRPIKRGEHAKATLGRIKLVAALLPVLGVAASAAAGVSNSSGVTSQPVGSGAGGHAESANADGFSADAVMRFAAPALTSASADVRATATELVEALSGVVGHQMLLPMLPPDLNPKLRQHLEAKLTGEMPIRPKSAATAGGANAPASRRYSSLAEEDPRGGQGQGQQRAMAKGKPRATSAHGASGNGASGAEARAAGTSKKASETAVPGHPKGRPPSNKGSLPNTRQPAQPPRSSVFSAAENGTSRIPVLHAARALTSEQAQTAPPRRSTTSAKNEVATDRLLGMPRQHNEAVTRDDPIPVPRHQAVGDQHAAHARETRDSHLAASAIVDGTGSVEVQTAANEAKQPQRQHHLASPTMRAMYPREHAPAESPSSMLAGEYSLADEDPTPFEAELRAREARLGPVHPAVAEAAANLAIVHSQRGDPGAALPLYRRAAEIYEACHGPNHPEVAHCLTDIAVILLEAGRDAEGKRLLQRAYDIQVHVLGPGHPDVVAIADVLAEE